MIYESSLYHHGIRGQKWGVRNGPPYPLDEGNRSYQSNRRLSGEMYTRNRAGSKVARIIGTAGAVAIGMTWTIGFMKDKI